MPWTIEMNEKIEAETQEIKGEITEKNGKSSDELCGQKGR